MAYTHKLVWEEKITSGVLTGLVVEKSFRTILDKTLKKVLKGLEMDENVLNYRLERI